MAPTVKLGGERPPQGPESAPSGKPRPKRAAPRAGGGGGSSSTVPPAQDSPKMSADDKKLHASLVRFYSMIGVGMMGMGQARGDLGLATSGVNVTATAEDTANAWIELAQQNPRVRLALNGFVQGSAAANLLACHLGMIAPFLAARGTVPPAVGMLFLGDEAKEYWVAQTAAAAAATGAQ